MKSKATKVLKILVSLLLTMLLIPILIANVRVHYSPDITTEGNQTINNDLLKELRYLKQALAEGADNKMQEIYPEGYLFINSLYGLAWCNFLQGAGHQSPYFREGHEEIQKASNKIHSDIGRGPFDANLALPYGAFYNRWSTYLLGRKLSIEPVDMRDEKEIREFTRQCERIATSVQHETYPSSYHGGAWPADVVLCMASLSLHDKLITPQYDDVLKSWVQGVRARLDIDGLIPHAVNPLNGEPKENARGSSQSLMLIFLREIDKQFAEEQFRIFKSRFPGTILGLHAIREYAGKTEGSGDVDSGPIVLGMGAAATIVGIQTFSVYGDPANSARVRNTIEATGFPITDSRQKVYLFGLTPMADAFIAWGHSANLMKAHSGPGFYSFHLYSALVALMVVALLGLMWRQSVNKIIS